MRKSLISAAVAAVLIVIGTSADAKPTSVLGNGCVYSSEVDLTHDVLKLQKQTFKPTFSVLKKVKLVLYQYDTTFEDGIFYVTLYTGASSLVAYSDYAVLSAGTSYDDAARGEAVTFSFANGVAVVPGQTYRLELSHYQGTTTTYICYGYELYADGDYFYGLTISPNEDLEFAVTGGGKPK